MQNIFGIDATYTLQLRKGQEIEKTDEGERTVLKFPYALAPVKIAIFPLLKNKPELVVMARKIFDKLSKQFVCEFDDNGNIGKRYRRQDEIGTPFCITIDFDTLEDETVTLRDRDTMQQERVKIDDIANYISDKKAWQD